MKDLIKILLENDLIFLANKLGFISKEYSYLDEKDAVKLLNYAEHLSRRWASEEDINECLLICSLIWENRNPSWVNISTYLKQILIKIGLAPTAIMIDESKSKNDLTSSGNIILDLNSSKYIQDNLIKVNDIPIILTHNQKDIWDSIFKYNRIGISAPTSAGKSFILCLSLIYHLSINKGNAFYIVPNISLINQVTSDLKKIISKFNIGNDILLHQSYNNIQRSNNIFILTQERAFSALLQDETNIDNLNFLIVDEVQNIERVTYEDNERADDLLTVLRLIHENIKPDKIIISGPRIENIENLVKELFDEEGYPINVKVAPVLNITYSFKEDNGKYFLYQHNQLHEEPIRIELDENPLLNKNIFGKKQLKQPTIDILSHISEMLQDDSIILFSSTKDHSLKIAQNIKLAISSNSEHESLIKYIEDSVHENYNLANCIKNGVAYHNANVPLNIRNVIEIAFKKKLIKLLTTTTTLLQGINLPAKYLIARNHRLNVRGDGLNLTAYEFANLRGRAGRLMEDFVGRAIIIDYKAFEDTQLDLFEYPTKEVSATYEHRFNSNKEKIINALINSDDVSHDHSFNDLIVYCRNSIYRYGIDVKYYFKKHNIDIEDTILNKVIATLSQLTVPKDYCISNPHWDVLQLQNIYNNKNKFSKIPKSPFSSNYYTSIKDNLELLNDIVPYYYKKYFNIDIDSWEIDKIIKLAMDWSQEIKLSEIIKKRIRTITSEKIERHIEMINNIVSYKLPKILKPVIYLQEKDNPILSFMEFGAYSVEIKKLIEFGIPRDDSINIMNLFKYNIKDLTDKEIKNMILNDFDKMNIWTKYQLNEIL